jgi:hypothetical protein
VSHWHGFLFSQGGVHCLLLLIFVGCVLHMTLPGALQVVASGVLLWLSVCACGLGLDGCHSLDV